MKIRLRHFRGLLCALAAYATAFTPLMGVMHDFTCHDAAPRAHAAAWGLPQHGAAVSYAPESAPDAARFHHSENENTERHDSDTCSTCQVLLQLATSAISGQTTTAIPEPCRAAAYDRATRTPIAGAPHGIPFPRAPPAA